MDIPDDLVAQILKGNCVLFIGAGASIEAGAPSAKELAVSLSDTFLEGHHRDEPLPKVAAYVENKPGVGRARLIQYLSKRFTSLTPSQGHLALARFKWSAIYTTNYDTLIEQGYQQNFGDSLHHKPVLHAREFATVETSRKLYVPIYKPHGCISRAFSEDMPLVITEDDYYRTLQDRSALLQKLRIDAYSCPFLFVGYSLSDYDFSQIWFEVCEELGPFKLWSYAVCPEYTEFQKMLWRKRKVELLDFSFKEFFKQLAEADRENVREFSWILGESRFVEIVKALVNAIEARDPYTKEHSMRVHKLSHFLSIEMELSEDDQFVVETAALLHDVGLLMVKDDIKKKEGSLTEEEFNAIKEHSVLCANMIGGIEGLEEVAKAIRHHHEFFDGKGYPEGLSGEDIPLASRVIRVADTFDAMASPRPYRKGLSKKEAISEIKRMSGSQFDPKVVNIFEKAIQHV